MAIVSYEDVPHVDILMSEDERLRVIEWIITATGYCHLAGDVVFMYESDAMPFVEESRKLGVRLEGTPVFDDRTEER